MNENQTNQNPSVDFDNAQGEAFVGLNLLKLNVGQADGPFVVDSITLKEFGKGSRKNEIPQMVAKKGSTPYTMPIAASFIARMEDAKLAKGDTFLLKRTEDYTSQDGTEGCQSYIIKVLDRAEKK
jgi:hypothetical protein